MPVFTQQALITPATLSVTTAIRIDNEIREVRQVDMWTVINDAHGWPKFYSYYVPTKGRTNNNTFVFIRPCIVVTRLPQATFATGQTLRVIPPELNSSYSVNF